MLKPFKFLITIFIIMLMLSITGCYYQTIQTEKDLKENPPIGKIVKVDNIKYHLNCVGRGSPTVLLEAGLGENSLSWYLIQNELAKITKVCSYDRAGLGWSSGLENPMSVEKVAINLNKLLKKAEINSSLILVAHSRGGIFARKFYNLFPNNVKGMVLVDSTHENGPYRTIKYSYWDYFKQKLMINIALPLSKIGFVRLMGWANVKKESFPLDVLSAQNALRNSSKTAQSYINEIIVMREGLEPSNPPPTALGNLHLIVITSGKRTNLDLVKQEALSLNKNIENELELAKIEFVLQKELLSLSSNSEHIIAEKSGHMIMYDQPDLIINAITQKK